MRQLIVILHNIRSCYNVGSILRTADGLGAHEVIMTGYTPYPKSESDDRLPHLANKIDKQIAKSALGAETSQKWRQISDLTQEIKRLEGTGWQIAALEQAKNSINLKDFKPPAKLALIVGNEVDGLDQQTLKLCQQIIEIPMQGKKESLNVSVATAIALYAL